MNDAIARFPSKGRAIDEPHWNGSLYLQLAGMLIATHGLPDAFLTALPKRLMACRVEAVERPQRVIRIVPSASDHLLPPAEGHDLNLTTTVTFEPMAVNFRSDWCEGRLDLKAEGVFELAVHPGAGPYFGGLLENALRLVVAYDVLAAGGLLLHSGAFVRNEQAVIVFGHSGAGKSTTSRIALNAGCSVISDDVNVLEACAGGWHARHVPFSGSLNNTSSGLDPVPVRALYRLHKSESDRIEPCSPAHAISLLSGSAPFVNQDPHRGEQLFDILSRLVQELSVEELFFTQGPRFLDLVFKEP